MELFSGLVSTTFSVDQQRRTMRGLVIPWDEVGEHDNGNRWMFARGSVKFAHAKFVRFVDEHFPPRRTPIGRAVSAEEAEDGLYMTFSVDPGPHGDRALAQAASGKKVGLSVEVEAATEDIAQDPADPRLGIFNLAHATAVALVNNPAFTSSRLISVMASREGGTSMEECATCGTRHAPGVACPTTPESAAQAPAVQPNEDQAAQFAAFMAWQQNQPNAPQEPEERATVVRPRATAAIAVQEPLPYRFSHQGGKHVFRSDAEHDFSTDLFAVLHGQRDGRDYSAPLGRVNGFISAAFADVEYDDIDATTPNRHRPDMWQPQMDYATPLWDMVGSGSTDGRKFDIPKFTSSSGLVSAATEKTEPAGGSFVAELQTITPTQVWGKVEITRQAWRAGGSPQLSGILWDQMLREYYEDREAAVATFLNTLTAATDITLTGTPAATPDNDDDQVTANDFEMAIAALQFVRGGNRFRAFAAHIDLYKVLARVKDDAGRPMYPMINPQNANGRAANLFGTLNVAGTTVVPSWALGATGTVAANSWLFDPAKVRGWASAPERLFWDFGATVQTANIPQLSFVTLGIYGDVAFGNTDINGVRQVIFDPSV